MIICAVLSETKSSDCNIVLILLMAHYFSSKVYRKSLGDVAQIYKLQHWYDHNYEHRISEQSKYFGIRICLFVGLFVCVELPD